MNSAAIIYVLLITIGTGVSCGKHGQPRKPHDGGDAVFSLAISLFLLWQAGLFQ